MSGHLPKTSLARLEAFAKLMDGAFVMPGTNTRIGLDGITGLMPGVGDAISGTRVIDTGFWLPNPYAHLCD